MIAVKPLGHAFFLCYNDYLNNMFWFGGNMVQESLRHKQISSAKGILYILCIVIIFFIANFIGSFIEYAFQIRFIQYVLYVALIVLGTFIIKNKLQGFQYTVKGRFVQFDRLLGRKVKTLEIIELENMVEFGKKEILKKYQKLSKSKYTFLPEETRYYLIHQKKNKLACAIFSPSEKFAATLANKIQKSQEQESARQDETGEQE